MINKIKALQKKTLHVDDFIDVVYSVSNHCSRIYSLQGGQDKILVFDLPEKENVVCVIYITVEEYYHVKVGRVGLIHKDLLENHIKSFC